MLALNPHAPAALDRHLRVEVVDAAHRDWPAVRQQVERSGRLDRLMVLDGDGRLSARQAVVAAFLQGRVVGHACLSVRPARTPAGVTVVAGLDSRAVDAPFVGTAVEQVLMTMAESRARTMGCRGLVEPRRPRMAA